MKTVRGALLCAAIILVAVAGCGGSGQKKRLELLDEAIDQYTQALRWGRYLDVQEYHMTRDGERRQIDPAAMQAIRVTGVSIQNRTVNEGISEATVTGQIEFYQTDVGTVRHAPMNQTWWYEPEAKRWLLDSAPPAFQ
ncbi:MAG: hypothetical protein HYY36_01680 [Gammaproteobacteria bacterium]|nr:hypothetical protein [Gammaproteobacteria bacterium]